jgi:transposase-like protein
MLDGVVLARKTGAGALRRPVLVALGILPDGRKEVIDFRLAWSESAAKWERFLTDLYRRGLTGTGLDMISVDGGAGLLAALPMVYPDIAVQRCWAHKIRNVLNKVKKTDQPAVKRNLHKIMNAANAPAARAAVRRLADRCQEAYPSAVACLRNDLDDLLTCFRYKDSATRKKGPMATVSPWRTFMRARAMGAPPAAPAIRSADQRAGHRPDPRHRDLSGNRSDRSVRRGR